MQRIPLPKTNDANIINALILLNKEIEDLKEEIAKLKEQLGNS